METLSKVRRIGNSRGILFPKAMLEETGIGDTVKITVKNKEIVISPTAKKAKKKWSDFRRLKRRSTVFVANRFDSTDWAWE